MARQRGRVVGRSGRKTDYQWTSIASSEASVNLATGTVSLGSVGLAFSAPATIFRTRGYLFGQLDAGAVDDRALVAFGIALVSNTAFVAGVASLPSPANEAGYPWYWKGQLAVSSLAEGAIADSYLADRIVIDTKAMRKAKPDEIAVIIAEIATGNDAGGTFDWMYQIDTLSGYSQLALPIPRITCFIG